MAETLLYRAEIQDDAGDTTYGPPESYANASKRLGDALAAERNVGGSVVPVR